MLNTNTRTSLDAGELYPNANKHILTLTRDALPSTVPAGMFAQTVDERMLTRTG
jgi:hypothetical protein